MPFRVLPTAVKPKITIRTLTDGGQPATAVATAIAEFLDGAERTLDLAQYDFDMLPETSAIVGGAIRRAAARGVRIRLVYNVSHGNPLPVPPPSSADQAMIDALPLEAYPIAGEPDLMHHKYVICDDHSVWTGSTNWTDDAWSRQENVIVIARAPEVAADYRRNFAELMLAPSVAATGRVTPTWYEGTRVWFTPGHGEDLSHRVAQVIGGARRRIRFCSPVLTTPPVIGALAGAIAAGKLDIAGCVDGPQMHDVARQWHEEHSAWKLPLLDRIAKGEVASKPSTPYGAGSVHDFMHAKLTVVDDTIFTGSFNLSRSGERNAENVLEIEDPELAEQLATFVDEVRGRYPRLLI